MRRPEQVERVLDGVAFRGRVPLTTTRDRPDLKDIIERFGELTDARDLESFDNKVVRQIRARSLRGPETFNFCRRSAGLGVQELAKLLDVDRRTISRWEHGDVQIPKPVMAIVALLADEHSTGESGVLDQLARTVEKRPKVIDVDAA